MKTVGPSTRPRSFRTDYYLLVYSKKAEVQCGPYELINSDFLVGLCGQDSPVRRTTLGLFAYSIYSSETGEDALCYVQIG